MWYAYPGEGALVVLTPEQVRKVQQMNKNGNTPRDLKEFAFEVEKEVEIGYDNVVGQDSLNRFENKQKPKKKKKKKPRNPNQPVSNA
jgi:hypothetical protein